MECKVSLDKPPRKSGRKNCAVQKCTNFAEVQRNFEISWNTNILLQKSASITAENESSNIWQHLANGSVRGGGPRGPNSTGTWARRWAWAPVSPPSTRRTPSPPGPARPRAEGTATIPNQGSRTLIFSTRFDKSNEIFLKFGIFEFSF